MTQKILDSLEILLTQYQPQGMEKIQSKLKGLKHLDQKVFFYLFAICSRWFETNTIHLEASSRLPTNDLFGVLNNWQWAGLARLYLLLLCARQHTKEEFVHLYTSLFNSADVQESVLLIQSLAFIPHSEAFTEKARVAARSNITTLFSAVAHNNDYAYRYFDEPGWNQLVLKAAFLSESIISIYGLKSRNNLSLAAMLRNYAKERHAASRTVPWDLWICVAWAAKSADCYDYLQTEFSQGDVKTKAAIALALSENQSETATAIAQQLLQDHELQVLLQPLTWEKIQCFNG